VHNPITRTLKRALYNGPQRHRATESNPSYKKPVHVLCASVSVAWLDKI
jgi:hypothetical protein